MSGTLGVDGFRNLINSLFQLGAETDEAGGPDALRWGLSREDGYGELSALTQLNARVAGTQTSRTNFAGLQNDNAVAFRSTPQATDQQFISFVPSLTSSATPVTNAAGQDAPLASDRLTSRAGVVYGGDPRNLPDDERFGIRVEVKPNDTGESLLDRGVRASALAAARAAGYSDAEASRIADEYIQLLKDARLYDEMGRLPQGQKQIAQLRRDGGMNFYVSGATLKAFDQIHYRKVLADAILQGKPLTDEVIARSGVPREQLNAILQEVGYQTLPTYKEAVESLFQQKRTEILAWKKEALSRSYIDTGYTNSVYYGMSDTQLDAYLRTQAEADIQKKIGKGEIILRPDDAPPTIGPYTPTAGDHARRFIENYLPGLANINSPEGIKTYNVEAFLYGLINARTFGATDLYVDRRRFNNTKQEDEARLFQTFGQIVGELQNLRRAGMATEAILQTPRAALLMATLRNGGRIGQMLANAVPTAITFGSVEAIKESIKGVKGESPGTLPAIGRVTHATIAGGAFGVLTPLPLAARVPTVAATSYGIDKVFGLPDREAATNAAVNALFAALGGRGGGASNLSPAELNGKTVQLRGANNTTTVVRVEVFPNQQIRLTELPRGTRAQYELTLGAEQLKALRGASEANPVVQMQRLFRANDSLPPAERGQIKLTAEGLFEINGQLRIAPPLLRNIKESDLPRLLSATRELQQAGGKIGEVSPQTRKTLEELSGNRLGYRLRFNYQLEEAREWLVNLGKSAGYENITGVEINGRKIFADMTPRELDRLRTSSGTNAGGNPPNIKAMALEYALSTKPNSVQQFAERYEFFMADYGIRFSQLKATYKAKLDEKTEAWKVANGSRIPGSVSNQLQQEVRAELGLSGASKDVAFGQKVEQNISSATLPNRINLKTQAELYARYEQLRTELRGRYGVAQIKPGLSDIESIAAIQELARRGQLQFSSESAAVYHSYKHLRELPPGEQTRAADGVSSYLESAQQTVTQADLRQTLRSVLPTQDGGARMYTFARQVEGVTVEARVLMTNEGQAFLVTYP